MTDIRQVRSLFDEWCSWREKFIPLLIVAQVVTLFDEWCSWREKTFTTNHQLSYCDEQSNKLLHQIRQLGFSIVWSDDPRNDGYYYGVTKTGESELVLTASELGYDLSRDPEYADIWNPAKRK